jgi:hypothetical protein
MKLKASTSVTHHSCTRISQTRRHLVLYVIFLLVHRNTRGAREQLSKLLVRPTERDRKTAKISWKEESYKCPLSGSWWVFVYIWGSFEKFVDSPYYSESELCGAAVMVSFSKYLRLASDALLTTLHPLLENVLQTGDHLKIPAPWAPFSLLEKPRNRMVRDLNWILCSAWRKWIGRTALEHPLYSPDLARKLQSSRSHTGIRTLYIPIVSPTHVSDRNEVR